MSPVGTVLGIDFNTKALDLVLLAEDSPQAIWEHVPLEGADALARLRRVRREIGSRTWFEDHKVYLVAVERPYGVGEAIHKLNQMLGAIVTSIPLEVLVWVVTPAMWRIELGLSGGAPKADCVPVVRRMWEPSGTMPDGPKQDAFDAYAIAYAAREQNARQVALALGADAA